MRWRAVYRTTAAALLALAAVRTAAAAGGNAVRELGEASAATSGQLWRPLSRTYQAPATATDARPLPEAPRRCRKAAVVTTINAPTDAIRSVAAAPGWCLIVVGDAITPNDEYEALASGFEGVTYLSLAAQRELPFESIPLTPERHFGRKNIGYLYATWCGAHVIFDFDDDNAPLSAAALDGPGHVAAVAPAGSALLHGEGPSTRPGPHACNPYPFFGAPKAWPRGLPLERINQGPCATATATSSEHRLGVVQSLANRDPDVDAIYRLGPRAALPLPFSFASEAPLLVLAPGAVAPFNAQATWWYGPAFGGLMLPTTVHGRVSDIWRSYVAQHAMRCDHLRLAFATPAVEQVRNDHEYLKDYMAERPLYEASGALVEALAAVPCAGTLGATIGKAYVVLYEKGFVEREDVARADAFLRDLGRARAGAPRGDSDSARPYTAEQLAPHGPGVDPFQLLINAPRDWRRVGNAATYVGGALLPADARRRILLVPGRKGVYDSVDAATSAAHMLEQKGLPRPEDYIASLMIAAPGFGIAATFALPGESAAQLSRARYDAVVVKSWDPCADSASLSPLFGKLDAMRRAKSPGIPRVVGIFEGYTGCSLEAWNLHAAFVLSFRNAFMLRSKHPRLPFIFRTNLGVVGEAFFGDRRIVEPAARPTVCFLGQHRDRAKSERIMCGLAAALPQVTFLVPHTIKNRAGFPGCRNNGKVIQDVGLMPSCSVQLDISWGTHVSHHTNTKTIIAAANGRVPVVEMPTNTLAAGFLFGEVVPQSASVQQWASAVTRALERSDDDRSAMQAYARTMYSWANVLHADLVDYLYTLSS